MKEGTIETNIEREEVKGKITERDNVKKKSGTSCPACFKLPKRQWFQRSLPRRWQPKLNIIIKR